MGTTGGNQSDKQDAIKVYGQYNGTNLATVAAPVAGGSQDGSGAGGDSGNPGGSGEGGQITALTRPAGSDVPDGAVYKRGVLHLIKFQIHLKKATHMRKEIINIHIVEIKRLNILNITVQCGLLL